MNRIALLSVWIALGLLVVPGLAGNLGVEEAETASPVADASAHVPPCPSPPEDPACTAESTVHVAWHAVCTLDGTAGIQIKGC